MGEKPESWTHWVLDALSFDPDQDHVTDLFAGSGAVARAVLSYPGQLTFHAERVDYSV